VLQVKKTKQVTHSEYWLGDPYSVIEDPKMIVPGTYTFISDNSLHEQLHSKLYSVLTIKKRNFTYRVTCEEPHYFELVQTQNDILSIIPVPLVKESPNFFKFGIVLRFQQELTPNQVLKKLTIRKHYDFDSNDIHWDETK
jgi:hypothetical protein